MAPRGPPPSAREPALTPIHSRGRRKKRLDRPPDRGRDPRSADATPGGSETATSDGGPPARKKRRRRRMAPLEALPAELLQDVHFLAGNVNLPRASPALCAKLSSRSVFMEFCLRHLACETTSGALETMLPEHQAADLRARDRQRSLVMECRFFTLDFFREYLRMLASRRMQAGQGPPLWEDYEHKFWSLARSPWYWDDDRRRAGVTRVSRTYTNMLLDMETTAMLFPGAYLIPRKLVRPGNWTGDRLCFLSAIALLQARFVDRYRPVLRFGSRDSADEGEFGHLVDQALHQAIEQRNIDAMTLLALLRNQPITDEHLRLGARQIPHGITIIERLVDLSKLRSDTPNFLDPEIWESLETPVVDDETRSHIRAMLLTADAFKR